MPEALSQLGLAPFIVLVNGVGGTIWYLGIEQIIRQSSGVIATLSAYGTLSFGLFAITVFLLAAKKISRSFNA